ncbi:hypothetical protein CRYUN_Cryun03dG0016700 [Craigia yunnanensis]
MREAVKQVLLQVFEHQPVFTYLDDPMNPSYALAPKLREVLVERAPKDHKGEENGFSIFKRIPVFLEELKARLEEELPKARTKFGNGEFAMANRIKKCKIYLLYRFVRTEVGTELLRGEKNVSPGEDIEKVHDAINEGKLGAVLLRCLTNWKLSVEELINFNP